MAHVLGKSDLFIAAPAEAVWRCLTDFQAYPQWHPFTPKVEVEPRVGSPVTLHVQMSPGARTKQKGVVTKWDPPREVCWRIAPAPAFLLEANRYQRIVPAEGGCRYQTEDVLTGWLAAFVVKVAGKAVQRGFDKTGAALKARCEAANPKA